MVQSCFLLRGGQENQSEGTPLPSGGGFINPVLALGILDYLREGFPWPAQPFQHTESNSFKHTATTFKYTNWYFILPPGPCRLARPPHI